MSSVPCSEGAGPVANYSSLSRVLGSDYPTQTQEAQPVVLLPPVVEAMSELPSGGQTVGYSPREWTTRLLVRFHCAVKRSNIIKYGLHEFRNL